MLSLPYPDGHFSCIESDNPWDGNDKGCRGFSGVPGFDVDASSQYDTMSLTEIHKFGLEMIRVAASGCHFWLWTTDLFLDSCLDLIKMWGLTRKRTHVWIKTTKGLKRTHKGLKRFTAQRVREAQEVLSEVDLPGKPLSLTGYWGKMGHEYLILCTNGRAERTLNGKFEPSVFHAPVPGGEHSAKPDLAYEIIRRNSPGPRLSMFQRTARDGFECWGNQLKEGVGNAI